MGYADYMLLEDYPEDPLFPRWRNPDAMTFGPNEDPEYCACKTCTAPDCCCSIVIHTDPECGQCMVHCECE